MLCHWFRGISFASVLLFVATGHANESMDWLVNDHDQRIAELEAAVQGLRPRPWQSNATATDHPAIYVGYTFLFSKLHYKESFQATVADLGTGTLNLIPFEQDHELTPRVWVGLRTASGIGVRASYWSFDHGADRLELLNTDGWRIPAAASTSVIYPAAIAAIVPGDQLVVDTGLEATTADLEFTYDLAWKRLEVTLGAGLRYAKSDQAYDAWVVPGDIQSPTDAALNWQRRFEGFGPMLSAQGRLPIGHRGFYGVGGVNVSFLFGSKTLVRSVFNDATPEASQTLPILVFDDSDEITGIYGANIGMGWQRRGKIGTLSIEGTYEGQLWTEGGAPTITFAGFEGLGITLGLAI